MEVTDKVHHKKGRDSDGRRHQIQKIQMLYKEWRLKTKVVGESWPGCESGPQIPELSQWAEASRGRARAPEKEGYDTRQRMTKGTLECHMVTKHCSETQTEFSQSVPG